MIPLTCPDLLFAREELPSCLPNLKALGFSAIDLAWIGFDQPEYVPFTKRIVSAARAEGLRIGAVWVHKVKGACSADPQVRSRAVERMRFFLELAVELNTAGVVTIDHCTDVEGAPQDRGEGMNYLGDTYAAIGADAARIGTHVFIEPLARPNHPLLDTIESAAEFCRIIRQPSIRVCADTYHVRANDENWTAALTKAKQHIGYVHFSDFSSVPGKPTRPLPGFGEIDFAEAWRAVQVVGYRGVVAIEGKKPENMTALEACAEVGKRLCRAYEQQAAGAMEE